MTAAALLLPAVALGTGCRSQSAGNPKPSPKPRPRPSPPALSAQVGNVDLTLLDKQGRPIARLSAKAGTVQPVAVPSPSPSGGPGFSAFGQLAGTSAVLYKDGKPSAHMTADRIAADQKSLMVTGTGNVTVKSLALPDSPAIRADKMVWRHADGTIEGTGHVLITRAPDLRVPGTSFTADTELRTFRLTGGAGPATGTF